MTDEEIRRWLREPIRGVLASAYPEGYRVGLDAAFATALLPTVRRLMQQQAAEELDYANREHGTTVAELSPIDRLTCRLVKSEDLVIRAATLRGEW